MAAGAAAGWEALGREDVGGEVGAAVHQEEPGFSCWKNVGDDQNWDGTGFCGLNLRSFMGCFGGSPSPDGWLGWGNLSR